MTTILAVPSLAYTIYLTYRQWEFPKIMLAVEPEVYLRKYRSPPEKVPFIPPPPLNADTQTLFLLRSNRSVKCWPLKKFLLPKIM